MKHYLIITLIGIAVALVIWFTGLSGTVQKVKNDTVGFTNQMTELLDKIK